MPYENSITMPEKNSINLGELKRTSLLDLLAVADELKIENPTSFLKPDLISAILRTMGPNNIIYGSGVLEVIKGQGFLRSQETNYFSRPDDVLVQQHMINRFHLKTGDVIEGEIHSPKNGDKFFSISRINKVNFDNIDKLNSRINFDDLTAMYPDEKFILEIDGIKDMTNRMIDLVSPIGKGQRALIVSPPRTGKTVMLQNLAKAIETNHPEAFLIVLLIDERPEEVTDMARTVKGEVVSSTFDEPASRHVQLAEMIIEKAKRLVEHKKDVVILLDSITRLARAYNTTAPASGKILTGGVDANSLQKPKRFFGAARNIEEGGSLTIIATALIDTGSRMDEVIFEEFKGTGNSEIILDRKIADKRIFPAIDILKSGTRKEELLLEKNALNKMRILRQVLRPMNNEEGPNFLIEKLRHTKNNDDFFDSMNS